MHAGDVLRRRRPPIECKKLMAARFPQDVRLFFRQMQLDARQLNAVRFANENRIDRKIVVTCDELEAPRVTLRRHEMVIEPHAFSPHVETAANAKFAALTTNPKLNVCSDSPRRIRM